MKEQHKSKCILCSVGCGFIIETKQDEAVNLEYDTNDDVCGGSLCSKGNFALELINHPMRLIETRVGVKAVPWKDALEVIAEKLAPFAGTQSVGLILGGDASVEDVITAQVFAKKCLGNERVAVHFPTGDDTVYRALASMNLGDRTATPADIEKAACVVAVGDPFEVGPVIAGRMLAAKYAGRRNMLAVVSDRTNRTSRFARMHLCGNVRRTLAALLRATAGQSSEGPDWLSVVREIYPQPDNPSISTVAKSFIATEGAVLVLETQDPIAARLAGALTIAAGKDKMIYPVYSYSNVGGISDVCAVEDTVDAMLDAADSGAIKALIVLGADIVKGAPDRNVRAILSKLDFLAAGSPFVNETTAFADPVLPTAIWMESEGTYGGSLLNPVIEPPGGALSYGEILRRLIAKMGYEMPPVTPELVLGRGEFTAEDIRQMVRLIDEEPPQPAVRSTVLQSADGSLTDHMSWMELQGRKPW